MSLAEITRTALELPVEDRLELARRLVESAVVPSEITEAFAQGIKRIEDVAAGRTTGLSEAEFRLALE